MKFRPGVYVLAGVAIAHAIATVLFWSAISTDAKGGALFLECLLLLALIGEATRDA